MCCCCWKCCKHNIVFCDRDEPCNIDFLPQTHQEEDDYDGLEEEDLAKRNRCKECCRRSTWVLNRGVVRCCTFYWRSNPCAWCEGQPAGTCYLRHKPSPRFGLILIATAKIITFLVYAFLYTIVAYTNFLKISTERRQGGAPPRGSDWINDDPEIPREIHQESDLHFSQVAFRCAIYTVILCLSSLALYLLVFLSSCFRYVWPGFVFLILWIFLAAGASYHAYNYITQSTYTFEYLGNSVTVHADIYDKELYSLWGVSFILVPYEIWLFIWHLRQLNISKLKRLGFIVEDSTEFLVDAIEPNQGQVFIFEDPEDVYSAGTYLMSQRKDVSEFEFAPPRTHGLRGTQTSSKKQRKTKILDEQ